jgi:hypothetical protein
MNYTNTSYLLTYTVNGSTYTLSGTDSVTGLEFNLLGDSGWGIPTVNSITDRGALQNGDTPIDFRIEPRSLGITLFVEAFNYVDHLQIRETISRIFKVSNNTGTLTITYSSTIASTTTTYSRSIDVLVRSGLDFGSIDYQDYNVLVSVGFRASDPAWYDNAPITISVSQAIQGTTTPIPLLIPMTMGGVALNQTSTIVYTGTVIEYPKFTIVAGTTNITGLYIINQSTNKTIYFPTLYANRTYTIDLTYGNKTIVDDLGANCIGLLALYSNLATWSIDPNTSGGTNVIVISSSGANSSSTITMNYYVRYLAV